MEGPHNNSKFVRSHCGLMTARFSRGTATTTTLATWPCQMTGLAATAIGRCGIEPQDRGLPCGPGWQRDSA